MMLIRLRVKAIQYHTTLYAIHIVRTCRYITYVVVMHNALVDLVELLRVLVPQVCALQTRNVKASPKT